MKLSHYISSLAVLALALSGFAFAKDTNSGSFQIDEPVQIGSAQLAPGTYKVEWSGPANNVKVDIMHQGKTVAMVNGKLQDLAQASPYNSVTVKTLPNHIKTVDEIDFNNRTEALVLNGK